MNRPGWSSRILATAMALAWSATLPAGDMYKWQDADGIWHFSDKPPSDGAEFESLAMPAEPRIMVSERRIGTDRNPAHIFFNEYWGPAELELSLAEAANISSDPVLPARFVLPAQTEQKLVTLQAANPKLGFRYRLSYALVPGPPSDILPADLEFYPPFPLGTEYAISQGIDDERTHTDAGNRYAVDIAMPIGASVLAARSGVVMHLEDDFHGGGKQEQRYMLRANVVRILHDDGSMAVYAHLEPNSGRVRPGARVEAGSWIANSGNTGFSSGPHLHFVIQQNVGMALESLPFRFKLPGGGSMDPDRQQMLKGVLNPR